MSPPIPRLELCDVTKRYPGVVANDRVSLTVWPGSIHAVLGENGAGKSTLMKIIYGVVQPDEGTMRIDGREVRVRSPQQARELGIGMVFQHFSLFETLTVADNVWLGLPGLASRAEVVAAIRDKAAAYGLELDPERPVHSLSVGERQRVEIVRALLGQPRLLILDEPTSVLTPQAVQRLFGVLRQLAAEGCSILYISHKLHEIRALCDACTVMRGGRVTGEVDPRQASDAELSRLMIGREPPPLPAQRRAPGEVVLRVAGLTLASPYAFGTDLHDVRLELRAGEIVGIAGVSGNGQRELLAALSGEEPGAPPGTLQLDGQDLARANPAQRRRLGLHFVPEERLGRGAVPALGLAHNLLLTRTETVGRGGWLRLAALRTQAAGIIERYGVKAAGPDAAAQSLSGGNLQKFIVGREIEARPRVLIVAQPTWGVDVGAAAQIRAALLALREAGCAVLVVSEELDELFELCDRLHVIAKGHLSPGVPVQEASVERIGAWMAGQWPGSPLAAGREVADAAA
ncbi:Galactose/methyl galactoside import ATP-binding protein MglA [Tepidimonas alkaliphilus]|uniref:Galactose/methyl galactoside import ATP-binding protein MglA n=2 Tax=Tepidimonas alkaliphilus TaxID=2588942 RepID=A0A554W6M8_9BURK|nr:ABC transporter ATP-binding protein [Tepidimonas alkaliphilus]TSE19224.1 Galactose/methyl galactoside import ATP-binding protein MglA [Tepidimonas alkaliphilus]